MKNFLMMHIYLFQLNMFSNFDDIILEFYKWYFNIISNNSLQKIKSYKVSLNLPFLALQDM